MARISLGSEAKDRSNDTFLNYTVVDLNNPASENVILDTFEVWLNSNTVDVYLGTAYGSGTEYTTRNYANVGKLSAGAKRTITGLSIEAQAGDFIAGYAGRFETDTSGGAGYYRISGNIFGEGLQANYLLLAGGIVSLYAEGETVSAGRKAAMHYYRNLMAGGVGRC